MKLAQVLKIPVCRGVGDAVVMSNQQIIITKKLALFSSQKVPGTLILKTYDIVAALRDAGVTVIGGFHSHMEKECLKILLRGIQPIMICPARSIKGYRDPVAWKKPIQQGQLTLLSNFPDNNRRVTAETAEQRNRFVIDQADAIFIPYAAPGGMTEGLAKEIATTNKSMYTIIVPETMNLQNLGAIDIDQVLKCP